MARKQHCESEERGRNKHSRPEPTPPKDSNIGKKRSRKNNKPTKIPPNRFV